MNQQEVKDSVGLLVTANTYKLTWQPYQGKVYQIIKLTKAGMAQLQDIYDYKAGTISVPPSYVNLI